MDKIQEDIKNYYSEVKPKEKSEWDNMLEFIGCECNLCKTTLDIRTMEWFKNLDKNFDLCEECFTNFDIQKLTKY